MGDSFSKKENSKKKAQKLKEKAQRREDRKTNNNKGKGLEAMISYVDENGNLTSTPPDKTQTVDIELDDILLGAAPLPEEELEGSGVISFFNEDKGYGFIIDDKTKESIFVHINQLIDELDKGDRVTFEKEKNPKGYIANNVKKEIKK